jgi:hypothetical protein
MSTIVVIIVHVLKRNDDIIIFHKKVFIKVKLH